jgi:hypothetical protein
MSSGCDCFAGVCGDWRDHVKPTVLVLNLHPEGKEILLMIDRDEQKKLTSRVHRKDIGDNKCSNRPDFLLPSDGGIRLLMRLFD